VIFCCSYQETIPGTAPARLVTEARAEDPSLTVNQVVLRIGSRVEVVPGTLRGWVKQAGIDGGLWPGTCRRP
jgi:hypothetical protein